jgi:hypothetical protein
MPKIYICEKFKNLLEKLKEAYYNKKKYTKLDTFINLRIIC